MADTIRAVYLIEVGSITFSEIIQFIFTWAKCLFFNSPWYRAKCTTLASSPTKPMRRLAAPICVKCPSHMLSELDCVPNDSQTIF